MSRACSKKKAEMNTVYTHSVCKFKIPVGGFWTFIVNVHKIAWLKSTINNLNWIFIDFILSTLIVWHTGSNTWLQNAFLNTTFCTGRAKKDCECLLCRWSRGSSSVFRMTLVITASSEKTAPLVQWNSEELAGTTVSLKDMSQGEGKQMVKALFNLCSRQWTCGILSTEDKPFKKGFLWHL